MATIETDLKDILTKIDARLDRIEANQNEFRVSHAEMRGDIKALDEKVSGIGKRLENQEFASRGIFVAVILSLFAESANLLGLFQNP
ncbi:hypothetical protein IQ225_07900 [Synechocystis salina LEGE 06155]|nr:hypothetical protein [Synechocystis salina LEGE 06155]